MNFETIADELAAFHEVSGLRVNIDKSHVFLLCHGAAPQMVEFYGKEIQWVPDSFLYLGINVYHLHVDLIEDNLGRAMLFLKSQVSF